MGQGSVSSSPRNIINTWLVGRASRLCVKRAPHPATTPQSFCRCLAPTIYQHTSKCLGYLSEQEIRRLPS